MTTYETASQKIPADATLSCTFGYPGVGGYSEIHRTPDGRRFMIGNGNHEAFAPFDWTVKEI